MDRSTAAAVPAPPPAPPPAPRQRRRLWPWLLAAVVVLVVVAGLAIAFGPQLVARHVVSTYLAGINIDTSGVDTLRIRPLRGQLTFGPVTFRGGTAEQAGQVGRIGVKVDVRRLLERQALVEAIVIEGVRFEVRQAADGAISLNGIPLSEILAEQPNTRPDGAPAPEAPGAPPPLRPITPRTLEEELGWGAGLDSLRILDSRVAFIDARGGEAVMHLHELDLGGFRTWAPDKPGRYRLQAEINDIELAASGIAKPFADKIELAAEATVTGIEVTKIERYLGPLGFTSRAGQIDLSVYESGFELFAAGRLQARLAASGTMTGVDLAHPLFGRGTLATGKLTLDNVAGSYDGPGKGSVGGDVGVDLQASEMRLYDGTEVGFSKVRLGLPGTTVRMEAGQQPAVRVSPELDVADLRLGGGDIRGTVGSASVRLSGFSIEGTEPGAPFLATGSVAVERVDLLLPEAEPVSIAADRVQVDLAETRLAFPPGRGAQVAGGVALDTRRLAVSVQQAAAQGRVAPPPTRIDAARLAFEMPTLTFDDAGEAGMTVNARGPMLSFEDVRLGGPDVQGSVGRAAFRLSSFGMQGKDASAPMVATGTVAVDRLDLRLPDVEPVALSLGQLRAELAETSIALDPSAPRIEGGLSLDTRGLLVSIQEQARRGGPLPPPTRIEAAAFSARLPNVALQDGGTKKPKVRAGDPLLTLDGLRLGGPDIQGTVGNAVVRIAAADVETGEPGTPVVATGTVEARGLDLLVPDIEPIGIVARELDAKLIGTRFAFPSGRVLIEGAVAVDTDDLTVSIFQQGRNGGPAPPPIRIDARKFAGQVPTLRVDDSRATGTKVVVGTPFLALDRFRLDAPADPLSTLQLAASRMMLQRVDVNVIDAETLEVSGTGNIIAPDLSLAVVPTGGGPAGPTGKIARLGLDLGRFSYREAGDVNGFGMQGRIDIGSLQGRRPAGTPGRPADDLTLSGLQLDVADVDVEVGDGKPRWRARLDMELASLAAALRDPSMVLDGSVEAVSLRRFAAASTQDYALDALTIRRLDGAVTRTAAAPKPPKPAIEEDRPAARPWPPSDLPAVRVGRIALVDGGRVRFRDRAVTPAVDATLQLDRLSLADLDTTDPQARTTLEVLARLGDAVLDVRGWAAAFQARPSFEMQARLDDLSLPMVSPYVAPDLGFDVLRGTLSLGTTATVTEGQLDGQIRARIVDVRMADRPRPANPDDGEARADELPATVAAPLSTMIRLIEDRDGAIEIAMPVRGDLLSPEFSYMRVVWDLLPRLLRAFVTSPVSFVSAARSLMAAGGAGSSDGASDGAAVATKP